jgi:hypothetical protein
MPLKMQTTPVSPNAIYFPQILIQTGIGNGELHISCQLNLAAAKVSENGKWEAAGQYKTINIPSLLNLPPDLEHLAPQVAQLYGQIVSLVDSINAVRKIL